MEWKELLESGKGITQADIARREGISRARMTQIMGMFLLASEIQQHILSMPDAVRRPAITERALRPIAQMEDPEEQRGAFSALLECDGVIRSY